MNSLEQVICSVKQLLRRPIAFHPALARLGGSVEAGLFLSQACYWSSVVDDEREGWFYKTQADWEEETLLSRRQQERARAVLVNKGVLEEKLIGMPAQLWFRVNWSSIQGIIGLTCQTSMSESAKLECTEQPNKYGGNSQTFNTETTSEITAETTYVSDRVLSDLWKDMKRPYKRLVGKSLGQPVRGPKGDQFRQLVSDFGPEKFLAGFLAFIEHQGKDSLRKLRTPIFIFISQAKDWIEDAQIKPDQEEPSWEKKMPLA